MGVIDNFVHCCSQKPAPDGAMGMSSQYHEISFQILGEPQNRIGGLTELDMNIGRYSLFFELMNSLLHYLGIVILRLFPLFLDLADCLSVFWNSPHGENMELGLCSLDNLSRFCQSQFRTFGPVISH